MSEDKIDVLLQIFWEIHKKKKENQKTLLQSISGSRSVSMN